MKRLFNIIAIAVLALTAMSCQPSIIGEWNLVKTEYYRNGELQDVETADEVGDSWTLCFQEDGKGYQIEYDYKDPMYWVCEEDMLYIDNRPIKDIKKAGDAKIKLLEKDELHLAREKKHRTTVYVFKRVD